MYKLFILTCLLTLTFMTCQERFFERDCRDLRIEEFTLYARCRYNNNWTNLTLDLNECFSSENGLLTFPGKLLRENCDRCYIQNFFHLYCHCYKNPMRTEDLTDNIDEMNTENLNRGDLMLSYMDLRRFIKFNYGRLYC